MRWLKKSLTYGFLWGWIPLCLLMSTCGGDDFTKSLVQTSSTIVLDDLRTLVQDLALAFRGTSTCSELEDFLTQLSGTAPCTDSGTTTTSFKDFVCMEGPPLSATVTLTQGFDVCQGDPFNANGTLTLELTFTDPEMDALLMASGLALNGLPYSFSNLNIMVDGSNAAICSGVLIVLGNTCGVAQNCNFCPL